MELTNKNEDYKTKEIATNETFDEVTKLRKKVEYLKNENKNLGLDFQNSRETNKSQEKRFLKLQEEFECQNELHFKKHFKTICDTVKFSISVD